MVALDEPKRERARGPAAVSAPSLRLARPSRRCCSSAARPVEKHTKGNSFAFTLGRMDSLPRYSDYRIRQISERGNLRMAERMAMAERVFFLEGWSAFPARQNTKLEHVDEYKVDEKTPSITHSSSQGRADFYLREGATPAGAVGGLGAHLARGSHPRRHPCSRSGVRPADLREGGK